jgi:hypothetical protein
MRRNQSWSCPAAGRIASSVAIPVAQSVNVIKIRRKGTLAGLGLRGIG